jgi:hypothetical protein
MNIFRGRSVFIPIVAPPTTLGNPFNSTNQGAPLSFGVRLTNVIIRDNIL